MKVLPEESSRAKPSGEPPTPAPPMAVASQAFRVAPATSSRAPSTPLASSATGGVPRRVVRRVLGTATWATTMQASTGPTTERGMVSVCVASGIDHFSICPFVEFALNTLCEAQAIFLRHIGSAHHSHLSPLHNRFRVAFAQIGQPGFKSHLFRRG